MTQAPGPGPDLVTVTIDDTTLSVPKGTLVIRAAELIGVQIPRFCDHPLLDPVGACRQCLVEVEGQRKPMASCTIAVTEGMVVRTQCTSEAAESAQRGVMELLLINHPLDCPVCDKGGECPLQNQAMSSGRAETRFTDSKRTFPKPINLSTQVLLDRERCVLCARCTRFSTQIAGDPFIELLERGALQQVGIAAEAPFDSYFSGNTVQICPVGALTGTAYRFRARPFDLVSTPGVCEHCASGCAQRTDHRRGAVLRRLAGDDADVNEEWNCDKGRWSFAYARVGDRITNPMVRDDAGHLRIASWSEAVATAAAGLANTPTGVLVGGRVTAEDAYAYAKFARMALHTNDIDFRARPHSDEETALLTSHVAAVRDVTYADLETAPMVLLAGFEPEEESPIVFLRLRKAVRKHGLKVVAIAPFASRGTAKLDARLLATAPGAEAAALDAVAGELADGTVMLIGERLAGSPGALSAAVRVAARTGARLAWVPRRAGERGALDAGCLPTLLPGGRPVVDPVARQQLCTAWNVDELPAEPGRDTTEILAAAAHGELDVTGGRRGRTRRSHRPTRRARRDRSHRFRRQPRTARVRGDRARRRGVPGVAGGREVRLLPQLGGPGPTVRGRTGFQLRFGSSGSGDPGRGTRCRSGLLHRRTGPRRTGDAGRLERPTAARPGRRAGRRTVAGDRRGRARRLADAAGLRATPGRRAVSGGNRPAPGGADVRRDRSRHRCHIRTTGDSVDRTRGDHPAPGDHRDAGSGGVATAELAGQCGAPRARGHRRCRRPHRGGRAVVTAGTIHPDPTVFGIDPWWLILVKAVAMFAFLLLTVLVAILVERKLLGRMQMRMGPNRVGPFGLLQSLADGIKLALKEGLIPAGVDKPIYLLAPVISVVTAILAFAVMPLGPVVSVFGHQTPLQLTDLPVAVLYVLAITSIGVYGIVLAGWASGSTYPLLGGLRSSAQVVSYEIAMALCFVAVFLYAGTMSTSGIVAAQTDTWYVFLLLPSFLVYLTAMVGETNRAPFDLPEAEGELVGGFHTEYSSLKFAMFFLAEYVNMATVSALAATLFLGGWRAPWPISIWDGANTGWLPLLWFIAKMWIFLFLFMWLRATLPRLRYDQFMALGWKLLIPVSLVWILVIAVLRNADRDGVIPNLIAAMVLLGILVGVNTLRRRRIERRTPPPPPPRPPEGSFPVPPLPATATEEAARA